MKVIFESDDIPHVASAAFVVAMNMILPVTLRLLTTFEIHVSEGAFQQSVFTKLVVARCINTAVIMYLLQHDMAYDEMFAPL